MVKEGKPMAGRGKPVTTAKEVAKAFLKLSQPEVGDVLTNLKIQKLVYYAQGFSLAINNRPLFKEDILAWAHGPVVRELYDLYKVNGASPIDVPDEDVKMSQEDLELISEVNKVYGQFSAWKLRDMTHQGAPWKETSQGGVIGLDSMERYFKTLVN